MVEPVNKRRRWPWIVLAVVSLLFGVGIAWHFRPLSAAEREMVGVWQSGISTYTLTADRRYVVRRVAPWSALVGVERGNWQISGGWLSLRSDLDDPLSWRSLPLHLRRLFQANFRTDQMRLHREGPDRVHLEPERIGTVPEDWTRDSPADQDSVSGS